MTFSLIKLMTLSLRGYTDKWDARVPCVRTDGRLYYNMPDQIKTIRQGGSVDMGDVFRHAETDENFILHVEFYDKKDKTNILESHILYVDIEKWKEFFKFDGYEFLRECLVDISNEYTEDAYPVGNATGSSGAKTRPQKTEEDSVHHSQCEVL